MGGDGRLVHWIIVAVPKVGHIGMCSDHEGRWAERNGVQGSIIVDPRVGTMILQRWVIVGFWDGGCNSEWGWDVMVM